MGQTASSPAKPAEPPAAAAAPSGCPVRASSAGAPTTPPVALQGGCPVRMKGGGPDSTEIDPKNMMPAANQMPAEGQTRVLSTERVESNIPQADGTSRWVYPSPQMFYNALRRKGKATGDEEEHMDAVVAIHNNMNERTWNAVLEWEKRHCDECKHPTLARFMGRPTELSVEAWARYLRSGEKPFDRHDWFINRCGREVRYIIDYYDLPDKHEEDAVPKLDDESSVKSIELVVRPALDSVEAAMDRTQRAWEQSAAALRARIGAPAPAPQQAQPDSAGAAGTGGPFAALRAACKPEFEAVGSCTDEADCAAAHIGLVLCMAKQVCEAEAARFEKQVASDGSGAQEQRRAAFAEMQDCLSKYAAASRAAQSSQAKA